MGGSTSAPHSWLLVLFILGSSYLIEGLQLEQALQHKRRNVLLENVTEYAIETTCTFQRFSEHALHGFNNHVIRQTSLGECGTACLSHQEFECLSFDYTTNSRSCFLSREDRHTQEFYFLAARKVSYFEKVCFIVIELPPGQGEFTEFVDKGVAGEDTRGEIYQPATLTQCMLQCWWAEYQDDDNPGCFSYEYQAEEQQCTLINTVPDVEGLMDRPGTTLYVPNELLNINECEPNPCVFGTCQDQVIGYECIIDTGTNCEFVNFRDPATTVPSMYPVIYAKSPGTSGSINYTLTWDDANLLCCEMGMTLATPEQLQAAFDLGFDQCVCGHLSDGSVQYPITVPRPGCEEFSAPGLRQCSPWIYPADSFYATYCSTAPKTVVHMQSPLGRYKMTLDEGRQLCVEAGFVMATLEELTAAWEVGYDMCQCGWVTNGLAYYPITNPRDGCQPSPAGIRECNPSVYLTDGLFDVYCSTL